MEIKAPIGFAGTGIVEPSSYSISRIVMEADLPSAAIFDLDGTLLDSVDLHAIAWHDAMVKFGHDVTFEQARSQIGKGGDKLIPVFLSEDEQRDHGMELDKWRGE